MSHGDPGPDAGIEGQLLMPEDRIPGETGTEIMGSQSSGTCISWDAQVASHWL